MARTALRWKTSTVSPACSIVRSMLKLRGSAMPCSYRLDHDDVSMQRIEECCGIRDRGRDVHHRHVQQHCNLHCLYSVTIHVHN